MGIDALCALPVETLAAKDCLMFLWATFPMLPEALRLIQAWGFTFKTVAFVWLKRNKKSPTWFYALDKGQCGNLPACQAGTPQTLFPQRPSVYHFPH